MKKIILSIMALSALASCQKSEELTPEVGGSSEVVFASSISTRVNGTSWEAGDTIGVFGIDGENVPYSISSGENAIFTSDDPLFYRSSSTIKFTAYYPYVLDSYNVRNEKVEFDTRDQSSEELLKAQDFMVAFTAHDSFSESNPPILNFKRKMSKIKINVALKDTEADAEISKIILTGIYTKGEYPDGSGHYMANLGDYDDVHITGYIGADISLFYNKKTSTIEAILLPQLGVDAMLKLIIDGKEFSAPITGNFYAHRQYNYNLSYGRDEVEFTSGSISDWTESDATEDLEITKDPDIIYDSSTSTYKIYTANGLRAFSDLVNREECSVSDLVVNDDSFFNFMANNYSINGMLMKDINLGGIDAEGNGVAANEFTAIGVVYECSYRGKFDGCGYKVSGLYINKPESNNVGLFGCVMKATIKNIGVSGALIGQEMVGGIVGNVSTATLVSNCYNECSVEGQEFIGGVVGNVFSSSVSGCYNKGSVIGSGEYVGGVVGCVDSSPYFSTSSVSDCYNAGLVEGVGQYVGGVVGRVHNSSANRCYYDKDVVTGVTGAVDGADDGANYCGLATEMMKGLLETEGSLLYYFSQDESTAWVADDATNSINDGYPILSWQL